MKTMTSFHLAIGLFIIFFLVLPLHQAQAQESGNLEPSETYSREELAQMLAPIALYPDALLSQILMASTYPIEVIEAGRWVSKRPALKGKALDRALLDKEWDPSVKAICHFPSVLALMSERITETTNLGNAFLAQEDEVMDMVQELRAKAHAQGNLTSTPEQQVIVEKETIIIKPADPRVIYVPYYDPFHVYGSWWYPAHRPRYWGPPGVSIGFGISYWPGVYFGFTFGNWSYFDWHLHSIYIDVYKRPRFVRHDRWMARSGHWRHSPRHRRGVAYRDKPTARRYGQYPHRSMDFRRDTRGFPDYRDRDGFDDDRLRFDRPRIEWDRRGDDRIKIERNRQERERVERERKKQEQAARDKQKRLQITRDKQKRERVERERQKQLKIKRESEGRKRVERERKRSEQSARDRQEQLRIARDKQKQQQVGQKKRAQERAGREQQQRSRDNVFNRIGDGRKERQSSKRGRVSRQGLIQGFSGKGRSGGDGKVGRDDRVRSKK